MNNHKPLTPEFEPALYLAATIVINTLATFFFTLAGAL